MIISCEQCQTQFKLDESRIPAGGARVRCSKCEHSFVVQPPEVEAEAESTLQGIAAGTVQEAVPVPESEAVAPGVTDPSLSQAMNPCDEDEVPPEEWTFDDEPASASELSDAPAGAADALVNEPDATQDEPIESTLGAAGVDATTDFGDDSPAHSVPDDDLARSFEEPPVSAIDEEFAAPPSPTPPTPPTDAASLFGAPGDLGESGTFRDGLLPSPGAATENAAPAAPTVVNEPSGASDVESSSLEEVGDPKNWDFLADQVPDPRPLDESEREGAEEEVVASAPVAVRRRPRPWYHPGAPANALGWCAAILLIAVGVLNVVHNTVAAPAPSTGEAQRRVLASHAGGASVQGLTVRTLENLYGPILVIAGVATQSATLHSGLQVQLVDADGKALEGAVAWAGPALNEDRLREEDPRLLQASLIRRTGTLGPGTAFHAVFEDVPADAFGVSIDQRTVPVVPGTPKLEEGNPEEGSRESSLPRSPSPSRE